MRNVKSPEAAMAMTIRPVTDGIENLVAGLGTARDKRSYSNYQQVIQKTQHELDNIFRGSWLAKSVVNTIPEDMIREWVYVKFDDTLKDNQKIIEKLEKKLSVKAKVKEALSWARLYGGSVIVVGIKGQTNPEQFRQPLNIGTLKKDQLQSLHVMDRWRVTGSPELTKDLGSPNFGLPEYYTLAESSVQIHHTRVIRFNGEKVPYFAWHKNGRWDDSSLQHVFDSLLNADTGTQSISSMLFEATVDVISVENLAEVISSKNGESNIIKRFQLASLMKSINRTLLIDGKETFTKHQINFANIDKIIDKFMDDVCGACGIPRTRLFGQSPGGMQSTGAGELRNYYDMISSKQALELSPQLEYLYSIIAISALGALPDDFEIVFNPLWQLSENEQAIIDKSNADRDKAYLEMGVVNEGVIARELKEKGVYRTMTDEDVTLAEELALAPEKVDETDEPVVKVEAKEDNS